jgi:hypothetical protein
MQIKKKVEYHRYRVFFEKWQLYAGQDILFPRNLKLVFHGQPKLVIWKMASPGMLRRVGLVRNDVSEVHNASVFRVTRIGELGTLAVTSNRRTLRRNVPSSPILVTLKIEELNSPETSVLTRATRRNIPEDAILHSHCRENLKSYIVIWNFPDVDWFHTTLYRLP